MNAAINRRTMGLDRNVWIAMIVVFFLSFGLVGYTFINKEEPCKPPNVTVNAIPVEKEDIHFVGEALTFKATSATNKKITWNFGDDTEIEEGFIATHIYRNEGSFTITTRVNGRCESIAKVDIKKPVAVQQDLGNYSISEDILGNDFPIVGSDETYSYSANAKSYEWSVKNSTSFPTQKGPTATFKFLLPGSYTIQLILNDNPSTRGYKEITVINPSKPVINPSKPNEDLSQRKPIPKLIPDDLPPLPPLPQPKPKKKENESEKPKENEPEEKQVKEPEKKRENPVTENVVKAARKIINIQNDPFKSKLEGVVTGQNDVQDFDAYLPEGGETHVLVNDESKYITFKELCDRIRRQKKITIESVNLVKAEDNLIQQIKVRYKKKGFLGL